MAPQLRTGRTPNQLLLLFVLALPGILFLALPAPRGAQGNEPQSTTGTAEASQPQAHKLPAQCADIGFPANTLSLDYYEFNGQYPEGWPEGFSLPADSLLSRQPRISRVTLEDGPVLLQTDGFTAMPWDELVNWVDSYFIPQFWCRAVRIHTAEKAWHDFKLPDDLADASQLSFDYRPINRCVFSKVDSAHITLERSECPECSMCYFLISIELNAVGDAACK